jgi:hypothetical protein
MVDMDAQLDAFAVVEHMISVHLRLGQFPLGQKLEARFIKRNNDRDADYFIIVIFVDHPELGVLSVPVL